MVSFFLFLGSKQQLHFWKWPLTCDKTSIYARSAFQLTQRGKAGTFRHAAGGVESSLWAQDRGWRTEMSLSFGLAETHRQIHEDLFSWPPLSSKVGPVGFVSLGITVATTIIHLFVARSALPVEGWFLYCFCSGGLDFWWQNKRWGLRSSPHRK